MRHGADTVEQVFGRRFTSCLGVAILMFVLLVAGLLVYVTFFKKDKAPAVEQAPK